MTILADHTRRVIRVLVADDSAVMRSALSRLLQSDKDIKVVGVAKDGLNAVQQVGALDPDVVTLDVEMPVMNGLEALQRIMRECPRPVIMFSSLTAEGAEATFDALALGAFDYVPKPVGYASAAAVGDELIAKVKAAYASRVRHMPIGAHASLLAQPAPKPRIVQPPANISLVAVGCSTGGPAALQRILPLLPGDFPVPLLVVQHMPPGFTGPFARRLDGLCGLRVKEAAQGQPLEPHTVSIAPAGWQTTVLRKGATLAVSLSKEPAGMLHMPSVDVMMLSVADTCGRHALGVILTGMGADGEHGMRALYSCGAMTIGQDERSCAVYGMPRACAEQDTLRKVLPLDAIPIELVALANNLVKQAGR
ncbi:MAG: chemotaxis response regulator protein-glutamate methylesterase [Terriglobales bacterium]